MTFCRTIAPSVIFQVEVEYQNDYIAAVVVGLLN
jgi:hypothetical protein